MDGRRFYNPEEWEAYLRMANSGLTERAQEGESSAQERMFERMMMGLRMTRGVDCARFARDFGKEPEAVWGAAIKRHAANGLLLREGERLHLTPRGMQVMNSVLVDLMED